MFWNVRIAKDLEAENVDDQSCFLASLVVLFRNFAKTELDRRGFSLLPLKKYLAKLVFKKAVMCVFDDYMLTL